MTGEIRFDYNYLLGVANTLDAQVPALAYAFMICLFIGFAVKLPVFPLHGWLPDAHAQAPTAGSVDLAGILIKTAAYGLLRFVIPFFPAASAQFADIAIILGLIGIFYGAWCAFQQTDMKRLLAYTSISHMGFVLLAIYAGNILTFQGLMIMMLAHGISSAALFIMCGQVYERVHTRDMRLMGGMRGQFPYLEEHIEKKKAIYERYKEGFKDLPVTMNPYDSDTMEPSFWLSCMLIDENAMCRQERTDKNTSYVTEKGKTCPDEIIQTLEKYNVESRPIWKPMHRQPVFAEYDFVSANSADIGSDIFHRGLCLPSDIKMTKEEQDMIIEIIRNCFE